MRISRIISVATLVTVALTGQLAFAAPTVSGAKAALASDSLDLKSMVKYALEDERAAHAEYEAIIGRLGSVRPFSNIILAEETHIRWLTELAAAHGIAVPADATLKPVSPADLASALEAGRQAEVDNIAMYDRFLSQDLPADVRRVFVQLKAASENHLRAFTTNRATSPATGRGRWN